MDLLRPLAPAWRATTVSLAASAALHAAVLVGYRGPEGGPADAPAPSYEATLAPAPVAEPAPPPPPAAVPRPRPRPSAPRRGETVAFLPVGPGEASLPLPAESSPPPEAEPLLGPVALALPAVPPAPPALPPFPTDAMPPDLTIAYSLTSAFADGEAEYTWRREGDRYEIRGTASASGFFAVILEGKMDQQAVGRVMPEGLRPERFTERLGAGPEEGLTFDWDAGQVEFRYSDKQRTGPLAPSSVDWLSMIFQLAHRPPAGGSVELQVFTQRRMYRYRLEVLGTEELELPFGRARTLHLRHSGEKPEETVDVWLGLDQFNLPVKLRYPVARNRLVIEQTATSVRAR